MQRNYKAALMKALGECEFRNSGRRTFTHLRKDGNRRVKLWFGNDVWRASQAKQMELEAALKKHYGKAYLGGYFINGASNGLYGKSFCVVLKQADFK